MILMLIGNPTETMRAWLVQKLHLHIKDLFVLIFKIDWLNKAEFKDISEQFNVKTYWKINNKKVRKMQKTTKKKHKWIPKMQKKYQECKRIYEMQKVA